MRNFRLLKSLLLILLTLFVSVDAARADNECFERDYNFIAFGSTDNVVHVRVLAFSSGGFDHWAGNDSRGSVKFHALDSNGKLAVDSKKNYIYENATPVKFFAYNAHNFDSFDDFRSSTLQCNLGVIRWTDVKTGEVHTLKEGEKTTEFWMKKEKIDTDRDAYFLEFDWIHPDIVQYGGNKKQMDLFAIQFDIVDEKSTTKTTRTYDIPTVSTESSLATPEFVAAMYNMDETNPQIGSVTAALIGGGNIMGYTIYSNGKKIVENNYPSGSEYLATVNLPQCDSVRTLSADIEFSDPAFAVFNPDGSVKFGSQTRLLHTKKPLILQPFHAIIPDAMRAYANGTINKGFNTLRWAFNNPDETDFIANDAFVIRRGYKPDFSDQQTIGTSSLTRFVDYDKVPTSEDGASDVYADVKTENVKGYFQFEDNTIGATYNPYGTLESDKGKKYNVTGLKTDQCMQEFHKDQQAAARKLIEKYLEIPVRKVYYSIERVFTRQIYDGNYSELENGNKFCYRDSVYKSSQLPHITNVTAEKTGNWQYDHKVKVRVRLDNYSISDIFKIDPLGEGIDQTAIDRLVNAAAQNGFKSRLYTWDESASIKLIRHETDAWDTSIVNKQEYTIPGSDVKLSEDSTYYYVDFDDSTFKPFTNYQYSAVIDAANSRYPIINNDSIWTKHPDDTFYFDQRAMAKSLTASKGYYSDHIFLKWAKVEGQRTGIKLYRRSLDVPGSQYEEIANIPDNTTYYRDTKGVAGGKWFMYKLEVSLDHNKETKTSTDSVAGCTSIYGEVSGTVRLKNVSSAMSGVTVTATKLTGDEHLEQHALSLPISEIIDKQKFLSMETQENLPLGDAYALQFWTKAKGMKYVDESGATYDISPTHNAFIVGGDSIFIDGKGKVYLNEAPTPKSAIELNRFPSSDYVCYTLNRNLADGSFTVYIDSLKVGTINVPAKDNVQKSLPFAIVSNWHVDEMRVFSHCLSDEEVTSYSNRVLSGREKGLVAYYHFDDNAKFSNGVAADASYQSESDAARYDLHMYSDGELVTDETLLSQMTDDDIFDVSALVKTAVTGPDGKYVISGLSTNEGVSYTVVPTVGGTSDFVYTKTGEPQATLDFSPSRNHYSDTDFEFMSVARFAGRVLYKDTTVPVRDAIFKINGEEVVSGNGTVIRTDQNGSFALDVPRINMTFQVVKDGHVFQNDGYVYENGRSEEAIRFTPSEDYIGLELWDNTKVRVAGRIVGGATQASKPLGMAQSENNLGDNITMVMALEGDNTSKLLYLKDQDEVKSQTETLVVNTAEDWWTGQGQNPYAISTKTVLEPQRLTIYPDERTGEFYVDLLPVRYKVTQLYANGYSTLFRTGETAQVLDLTNAHSTVIEDSLKVVYDNKEKMLHTSYNHTYARTHHSPVSVTYNQLVFDVEESYYGEDKVRSLDQFGNESQVKVIENNPETGKWKYLFGMPVFLQDNPYVFSVHAHEDFYYNNDSIQGRHEQVMTPNCKVAINNGLTDNDNTETLELDENGMAFYHFTAGSPTFGASENAFARTITFDALVDGMYYSSAPLKGFLMGDRLKEGSVSTYPMAQTTLVDVLRDPPGSTSYSYVDEGAQYNFGRKYDLSFTFNFNWEFRVGPGHQTIIGTVAQPSGILSAQLLTSAQTAETGNIPIPLGTFMRNRSAEYVLTLNDRIQTSSDPADVGAMADVYIGATEDLITGVTESYSVIDEDVYKAMSGAFGEGGNKVVAQGQNQDGRTFYMVTGNKLASVISEPVTFVYSQRHILDNIIPQLRAKRNALLLNISKEEAQAMADKTGKAYYVTDLIMGVSEVFGADSTYTMVVPAGYTGYDEVNAYNEQMRKWIYIITCNEAWKLSALSGGMQYKSYSLSGNIPVSHNESNSFSDSGFSNLGLTMGIPVNVGGTAAAIASGMSLPTLGLGMLNAYIKDKAVESQNGSEFYRMNDLKDLMLDVRDNATLAEMAQDGQQLELNAAGNKAISRFYPSIDGWNYTDDISMSVPENRSTGYVIAADGDSYMDIAIYRTPADSVESTNRITKSMWWITDEINYNGLNADAMKYVTVCDYVFDVKGGASRPWYEPDRTLFYYPGTPLSGKTLKIDNPRLNIPQAIVSNIPQDEKAVFTLDMTNDSEMPLGQRLKNPSVFTLAVDDTSNPDGLKITMDGEPLTNGRQFVINPHETLTKTIELTRGRKYDYEDIRLVLSSADGHLADVKPIAAHFMPTSSPVRISSPTNNWTLNTNASCDSIGYYMPIIVEGYDVTYQGFDHIEIQYKPSTKGDDSWVNLCSYYAADSLYQAATGNKAMITSGIINDFRFYGERDPMEMKYDLRAVCFSRMGTDFVTRSSEIMTGMKDTRNPRIIGMPDPKNGIVGYGDHITLSFTEPIAYNYLDKTSNFDVLGFINDNTEINNSSALSFPGTSGQKAETSVERNLSDCNFSIDMLMSAQEGNRKQVLMSHGTDKDNMVFGLTDKNQLFLEMNGVTMVGNEHEASEINGAMVHVGATYNASTHTAKLFFGNAFETDAKGNVLQNSTFKTYSTSGNVRLGYGTNSGAEDSYFAGKMLEVRLWSTELTAEEVSNYNQKMVSGHNSQMVAHWPLSHTTGNTAVDEVSGANLTLNGTQWSTRQAFSLPLNKREVTLAPDYFTRSNLSDYTLGFWFKSQTPQIAEKETVNIFSIGNTNDTLPNARIMRLQFVGKTLKYRTGQQSFDLGNNYNDGDWHHFAVSVNRSKNQAIVMLDGTLKAQLDGKDVNGLASDYAAMGDSKFVGRIDDVVLYNNSINATYASLLYNTIPDLTSPELKIYLPFSQMTESSQGLVDEVSSPYNMVTGDLLVTDENAKADKTDWAPIREAERLSKLEFDWSSNGTDLNIHLLTPSYKINKQNVFINVRDVQDVNGNAMVDAQSYAMYIDCNQLVWNENYLSTGLKLGEEDILTASFTNKGSTQCHFNMTTNVDWMTLAYDEGSIAPNSMLENYVSINRGLDPGIYVGLITLTDENGLSDNLEVYVTVLADEPKWEVDKRFDLTASLIGEVHIVDENNDVVDDNYLDIVGAFNSNGDCVGKTYITPNEMGHGEVFLTIYGDDAMSKRHDKITFRLWRADKGTATLLTPSQDVIFATNAVYGSDTPVRLSTSNQVWQTLALEKGWNWVSLNVAPAANDKGNINTIFADKNMFTEDDQIREGLESNLFTNGTWPTQGDRLKNMTNGKVYQIKVAEAGNYSVLGSSLTDEQKKVKLAGGSNWQQLPYPLDVTLSLKDALADYLTEGKAKKNDLIKSYDEFAILSDNNTWVGSMRNFVPGKGYYIQRASDSQPCDIDFSKVTLAKAYSPAPAAAKTRSVSFNSMPIVATFDTESFDVLPTDKLIAIVGGEKVAEAVVADNTNLYFLTLNEEEGQKIEFAQERNGEILNFSTGIVRMSANSVVGSLDNPYVVSLADNVADILYYNIQGHRISAPIPGVNIVEVIRKDGSVQSFKFFKK